MAKITAAQQAKVFNAALFAYAQKQFSFISMLSGKAPKGTSDINKKQTDPGAPIVQVTDLEKQKGDEVSVDIVHDISKEPTMNDQKLEGRGDTLTFATDVLKIAQTRHMVESGGAMQRKSTGIQLPPAATKALQGYYRRLEEERAFIHAAGARGTRYTRGQIVPLSESPNFNQIMVNPVKAPTYNRKHYGGDATSIDTLDSSDLFSLSVVDDIWLSISEMDNPLQHIVFDKDDMANESPFYVCLVSPRQWNDFYTSTTNKDWQQMQANAMKRGQGFNHPLFKGDCLMYRNILIKPYSRYIEFAAGTQVAVSGNNAAASESLETTAVTAHRGLVLGGQALATAWGSAVKKGKGSASQMAVKTKDVDHDNSQEHSISWMNGMKKLQFEDRDGRREDHGIIAFDTAVAGI